MLSKPFAMFFFISIVLNSIILEATKSNRYHSICKQCSRLFLFIRFLSFLIYTHTSTHSFIHSFIHSFTHTHTTDTGIGSEGAQSLSEALKTNTTLTSLDFGGERIYPLRARNYKCASPHFLQKFTTSPQQTSSK
jgi:hypothetical protein